MSDDQWFYVNKGSQIGPVTLSELQQRKQDGLLKETDLVWKEGFSNWLESKEVSEISEGGSAVATATESTESFGGSSGGGGQVAPAGGSAIAVETSFDFAGFWRRFAAALIDGFILMAVFVPLMIVFGGGAALSGDPEAAAQQGSPLLNGLTTVIAWLYFALMESSDKQGTLGKLALGIKVTTLEGEKVTFARATGRHFAKFLSGFILGIGYLMVAFTAKKQGLHDIIASTLVVKR